MICHHMICQSTRFAMLCVVLSLFGGLSPLPAQPVVERGSDVERDWRLQDGIGTEREPRSWAQAIQDLLPRGDLLIQNLQQSGVPLAAAACPSGIVCPIGRH